MNMTMIVMTRDRRQLTVLPHQVTDQTVGPLQLVQIIGRVLLTVTVLQLPVAMATVTPTMATVTLVHLAIDHLLLLLRAIRILTTDRVDLHPQVVTTDRPARPVEMIIDHLHLPPQFSPLQVHPLQSLHTDPAAVRVATDLLAVTILSQVTNQAVVVVPSLAV